jgi:hypothetical protein
MEHTASPDDLMLVLKQLSAKCDLLDKAMVSFILLQQEMIAAIRQAATKEDLAAAVAKLAAAGRWIR